MGAARALARLHNHGLGAIVGPVTSNFSSSILSAASMFSWNTCKRLIRGSLAVLGGAAVVLALKVNNVQALWFFTSDLVFVLLWATRPTRFSPS